MTQPSETTARKPETDNSQTTEPDAQTNYSLFELVRHKDSTPSEPETETAASRFLSFPRPSAWPDRLDD